MGITPIGNPHVRLERPVFNLLRPRPVLPNKRIDHRPVRSRFWSLMLASSEAAVRFNFAAPWNEGTRRSAVR